MIDEVDKNEESVSARDPNTPYANLTPELILAAIESLGFQCSGSLLALNSYENRVYQIGIEGSPPLIAKFYRPHRWSDDAIQEEHQFSQELSALEIPVVAPLKIHETTLHPYLNHRFALFPRKGGRALEAGNRTHLERMGRFIGRLHAVSACRTFKHRTRLDVQTMGRLPCQYLVENNFIPAYLQEQFHHTTERLLQSLTQHFNQIKPLNYIRLHGDCHPGNILWNEQGPEIVDLDDCLMGPAVQDIWMMLSGEPALVESQLDCILKGYCDFYDFNYRELKLIEPLRSLRLMHYAAWLAKRWNDPAFPLHFPFFNTAVYWQEWLQNLQQQLRDLT